MHMKCIHTAAELGIPAASRYYLALSAALRNPFAAVYLYLPAFPGASGKGRLPPAPLCPHGVRPAEKKSSDVPYLETLLYRCASGVHRALRFFEICEEDGAVYLV